MPSIDKVEFRSYFEQLLKQLDFDVCGLISHSGQVFCLTTDTKVLSTVFELVAAQAVREIADHCGWKVYDAVQTSYPDFTLAVDENDPLKIAVDCKTTYRRPRSLRTGVRGQFRYTLGSYTSFLRNGVKNIRFPYDQYAAHWILGFLYTRTEEEATSGVRSALDVGAIVPPYADVDWFLQEKYRIAGTSPGSGNTTNIGSIPGREDLEPFRRGEGPFAAFSNGEAVFRDYWANYDPRRRGYTNLEDYVQQRGLPG